MNLNMRDFDAFITRLNTVLQKNSPPEALLKCITKQNLNVILKRLIQDTTLAEKIKTLKPYEALRLTKEKSKLARTLCIVRAPDGEYRCILETKSKTATNKKRKVTLFEGAYKIGKPAWRIDNIESYVSMHVELESRAKTVNLQSTPIQKQVDTLQKEIAFAWNCSNNPFLHRSVLGARYTNRKGSYISVYSPKGTPLNEAEKLHLTQRQKEVVALQILQGLALIHQQGYIYQDIKTENILLFKDKDQIIAKFNDFGFVTGNDYHHNLAGTAGYESPEIAFANRKERESPTDYYTKNYKARGKTLGKKEADKQFIELKKTATKKEITALQKEYKKPHQSNDVWACGILLHEIFHNNKAPNVLPKEKHFTILLEPNRQKRVTIEKALKIWREKFPAASAKVPTVSKNGLDFYKQGILFQYDRLRQQSQGSWIASIRETATYVCQQAYAFIVAQFNYYTNPLISYIWPSVTPPKRTPRTMRPDQTELRAMKTAMPHPMKRTKPL